MNWVAFLVTYALFGGLISVIGMAHSAAEYMEDGSTKPLKIFSVILLSTVIAACFAAGLGIES